MYIFRAHLKSHIHTNPDGSKIEIRQFDMGEREFWDELTSEWIKSDREKRPEKHKALVPTMSIPSF